MLQAIERYMKQAIVDKVPSVSSSALVSSLVNKCYGFPSNFQIPESSFFQLIKLSVCAAHGEDELRCGEALGE